MGNEPNDRQLRVLAKCDYFTTTHLWPVKDKIDPRQWLDNFNEEEKTSALQLLNFFMFLSEKLTDALFTSNIHNLNNIFRATKNNKTCYFTNVTGENPNPTDSGYLFLRKTRDKCQIKEEFIIDSNSITDETSIRNCNIIFVDDFLGSGNQILTQLNKRINDKNINLFEIFKDKNITPFYCPTIATQNGVNFIKKHYPTLIVLPTHTIGEEYSVFSEHSLCWQGDQQKRGIEMIYETSMKIGVPDQDHLTTYWKGYRGQGLALSFNHGTPDATLPIFYWTERNWNPLIRK